ncbi:MAG: N-acetylmuramoyl-L-alanine amidase [Salinibacter sp.]
MRGVTPRYIFPVGRSLLAGRRQWGRAAVAALGLLVLAGVQAAAGTALVEDVLFTARSDGQGYVVRVRTPDTVKAYGIPRSVGPNELEWVLYNTDLADGFRKSAPEGPVRAYTATTRNGHLILRFQLDPERSVQAEAYRDGASTDLLLNLAYAGGDRPVADAGGSSSTESSGGGVQQVSTGPQGRASPAPEGASKAARQRWKLDTVVIDPGHGGKDPGATANGVYEKDIVLDVAHKLGDYIENRLGVDVVYTRTGDRFIPLKKRGHMANEAGAKLFISLHVNAARSRAAHGTETYFLGPSKTEAAEKVMERENSVIKYEDNTQKYEDYDEQALVRQTLTQSAYMRQSERLASLVQSQFENRVQRQNRGVHQAGFYVLWSASMPAVLVELGFLTNPREARFLSSDRGQTLLASGLFRAVRSYKKKYEKGIYRSE